MKQIKLKLEVDPDANAGYIELSRALNSADKPRQIVIDDKRLNGEIVVDVNSSGHVLGIEFIGVREMLPRLPS